jgi:hypothetical protein
MKMIISVNGIISTAAVSPIVRLPIAQIKAVAQQFRRC